MMTGAESLLCELLSCGSMDLKMLDDVTYGWVDVAKRAGWHEFGGVSFNELMKAVVELGIDDIRFAVDDRLCELEAIELNSRELDEDEQSERDALMLLNPFEDIDSFHNCLDTHVWFEQNGDTYRQYLQDALDDFEDNTGLPFSD